MMMAAAASSFTAQPEGKDKFQDLKSMFASSQSGVDYIMGLYDKVDVVVLGERDHRDTTQYDFINRLISDPRFIEKVGYVYTEVGTANTAPVAERIVTADYKDLTEFRDSALSLIRIEDFYPLWEKYNRYQFLENLYRLNSTLPRDKRIVLRGTDVAFDWSECKDSETYRKFLAEKVNGGGRDSIMADNFLRMFRSQPERGKNHKALLITNTPHALKDPQSSREGYILSRELGDNMRTVLINWTNWWRYGDKLLGPWLAGLPDSAYVASGRLNCGFDLAGSPVEGADYCNSAVYNVSDYADGMIYYLDPRRFVLTVGIPGIVSEDFLPELMRRERLYGESQGREELLDSSPSQLAGYYNSKRTFNPYAEAWENREDSSEVAGLDMEVKEAAILILKAIGSRDQKVLKLVGLEHDDISDEYLGSEVISIGDPSPYAGGEGLRIPFEVRLTDGTHLNRYIYLRKNDTGRWYFDGGL